MTTLINLTGHNPKGANTGKEVLPQIPKGGVLIGELASYASRVSQHTALAMRCRVCGYTVEGASLFVHAEIRDHHDARHPRPSLAAPRPVQVVYARTRSADREHRTSQERLARRALLTPCTGIITHTTRRGQPCGKPSTSGRCGRHPANGTVTVAGSCVPCPVLITRGARRGQACGRATPADVCDNHARMT